MQKKNENLLLQFVKKDYNNKLETVLEKKYFEEDAKNLLLSMLYKIDAAYKDYEHVKPNVETKEEFVERLIDNIEQNCENIKLINLKSQESNILGNKSFLIEKNQKRIICYPIERKLLYCISKISKNDIIVKDKFSLINKTLTDLINVGNCINTVEPMRDFNGFSWVIIPKEIESITHNLIYQDLRILFGTKFMNDWIDNVNNIDYIALIKEKINDENFLNNLNIISILLAMKYDAKTKSRMKAMNTKVELKLEKLKDSKKLVEDVTKEKKQLTKQVKHIDEVINDKNLLQKEYQLRNEQQIGNEQIFSMRVLINVMLEERNELIKKINSLNKLLNPQNYIEYKENLERKKQYLNLLEVKDIENEIQSKAIEIQKLFLDKYKNIISKIDDKQELIKKIYEFRYYNLLPFNQHKLIWQVNELKSELDACQKILINKAISMKVIESIAKNEKINFELIKNIFYTRIINLKEIDISISKEKDKYYLTIYDENAIAEKIEIENINKNEILIKLNHKVKLFH